MAKTSTNTAKQKAASSTQPVGKSRKDGYYSKIAPKAISQARNDIATWKSALRSAMAVEMPKRIRLQNLYKDISLDALLTSQMENRRLQTISSIFTLKDQNGTINEEATAILKSSRFYYDIVRNILDSVYYGPTVIEIISDQNGIRVIPIPRNNIEPVTGQIMLDENDTAGVDYRNAKEFNTWLFEFGHPQDFGLLNKAIPHVLFKRFAQSCWSELCEIYGIPPRVMKTNTGDPAMLTRAEQMMRDMGAAAWFIIDETESFEFAQGTTTGGDVYSNLIRLCNNENSLLISGAIIGQDTKNGNESKETISIGILGRLVSSDKSMVESYFNNNILGGLFRIGLIPDGLVFGFEPQEDIKELWTMTKDVLPFMDVDPAWVKTKFGIEVTGIKQSGQAATLSFFD
ncbi:MAG: DUF935 family protein [Bacteroidota bacterium]